MKNNLIQKITLTAILSVMSSILYFFFKFPLPFFPQFLEVNFSMIPIFIGGYLTGPIFGSIIVIVRFLVKLMATHTAGVGEFADLTIGLIAVLVSSIIYMENKTKKGALISLIAGALSWIVASAFINWLILIPSYINIYFNGDLSKLIAMLTIIPGVTEDNYMEKYIFFGAIPFNALLAIFVSTFTFFVYKPLHNLIRKISLKLTKKSK